MPKKKTKKTRSIKKLPSPTKTKKVEIWDPLADLCASLNSEYADGDYLALWTDPHVAAIKHRIPTGSNLLDMVLGGGFPSGRVVELYGWPSTGKTTLVSHIGANVQAMGGFFFRLDADGAVDQERDHRIGMLPERYLYGMPRSIEHGFELIRSVIDYIADIPDHYRNLAREHKENKDEYLKLADQWLNSPKVFAWDAIATSMLLSEQEGESGGVMEKARKVREGLRTLTPDLSQHHICLILVNHLSEQMGFAPKTVCGWAIKYWASLRIELKRVGDQVISNRKVGMYTKATIKKSKVSPPLYEAAFPLNFVNGIDRIYEAFDYLYATKTGVVTNAGGWFYIEGYKDQKITLHYGDLPTLVQQDPGLLTYLLEKMYQTFHGSFPDAFASRQQLPPTQSLSC